jgi:hypothetical protein
MNVIEYINETADDIVLKNFFSAMESKLSKNRDKGRHGWYESNVTIEQLSDMLREHVVKGDPIDVAILAMFIWGKRGAISPLSTEREMKYESGRAV